jgi:hypothetical protein
MKYFLYYLQERGGGTRWPCIVAHGNVFWWPFQPTRANRYALAHRVGRALSTDAWWLAWVGRKGRQNELVMGSLLCHGESGSGMFCGCVVAIIGYTRCRVQQSNNTQTLPIENGDEMTPHQPCEPRAEWKRRVFTCAQWGMGVRRRLSCFR